MTGLEPGIVTIGTSSYFKGNATNGYRFNNAADTSNLMILKDDGTLLVGKSSSSFGTDGFQANADGQIWATNASASVTAFNRRTTDGAISVFYKDGTSVGSIGTASGDLHIDGAASHSGVRFQASSLIPRLNGADTDNSIDLGYDDGSATHRWRNLYLSDGAYLGGTTAANKLDAYEEGLWTLTIGTSGGGESVSIGNTTGSYTKIGRQVTATIYTSGMNISAAGSGVLTLGGLPFTCSNGQEFYAVPSFGHTNCFSYEPDGYVTINANYITVTRVGTVSSNALVVGNPKYMMMTVTYFTDS